MHACVCSAQTHNGGGGARCRADQQGPNRQGGHRRARTRKNVANAEKKQQHIAFPEGFGATGGGGPAMLNMARANATKQSVPVVWSEGTARPQAIDRCPSLVAFARDSAGAIAQGAEMISSLFVINMKGEVVISRQYRCARPVCVCVCARAVRWGAWVFGRPSSSGPGGLARHVTPCFDRLACVSRARPQRRRVVGRHRHIPHQGVRGDELGRVVALRVCVPPSRRAPPCAPTRRATAPHAGHRREGGGLEAADRNARRLVVPLHAPQERVLCCGHALQRERGCVCVRDRWGRPVCPPPPPHVFVRCSPCVAHLCVCTSLAGGVQASCFSSCSPSSRCSRGTSGRSGTRCVVASIHG